MDGTNRFASKMLVAVAVALIVVFVVAVSVAGSHPAAGVGDDRTHQHGLHNHASQDAGVASRYGTVPVPRGDVIRKSGKLLHRKDVKDLSSREKRDFVRAIKELKRMPPPPGDNRVGNWYDHFVAEHVSKLVCWNYQQNQGGWGHFGSDLVTFHRALLLEFEHALAKAAGKPIAIPYWDWTSQASTDAMLSDDLMGPSGKAEDDYYLTSGPFRVGKFPINVKGFPASNPGQFDWIVRAVGTHGVAKEPPSAADVKAALSRPKYNVAPWGEGADQNKSFVMYLMGVTGGHDLATSCVDGLIEAPNETGEILHTEGHDYLGGITAAGYPGSEADVVTSPNDPVFWLHHSQVDRISEKWWKKNNHQYLPKKGGPRGDNYGDVIEPYKKVRNGDMAVPSKDLGYTYDSPK